LMASPSACRAGVDALSASVWCGLSDGCLSPAAQSTQGIGFLDRFMVPVWMPPQIASLTRPSTLREVVAEASGSTHACAHEFDSRHAHLQRLPYSGACLTPVQPRKTSGIAVQAAIIVHDVDDLQPAPLPHLRWRSAQRFPWSQPPSTTVIWWDVCFTINAGMWNWTQVYVSWSSSGSRQHQPQGSYLEVDWVVTRGDLQCARAKLTVHCLVGHNRDGPEQASHIQLHCTDAPGCACCQSDVPQEGGDASHSSARGSHSVPLHDQRLHVPHLSVNGTAHCLPMNCAKRGSSGCTATAVSPRMVSGRVVATCAHTTHLHSQ
jgi:hypothetical protein